jgi:hypothetical protein
MEGGGAGLGDEKCKIGFAVFALCRVTADPGEDYIPYGI